MQFVIKHILFYGLILSSLNACSFFSSNLAVTPQNETWLSKRNKIESLTHFRSIAKFKIQYDDEQTSGLMNWVNKGDNYSIFISGPIGKILAKIIKTEQLVTLNVIDESEVSAPTAEELLEKSLGWSLPISGLVYWIKGIPDANFDYTLEFNKNGYLNFISQQGWEIKFLAYSNHENYQLPRKIVLSQENITITIIIKSWDSLS